MKRKSILIGFEYTGDKKLPGITVDLYQVYNFLKRWGWKDDEITVYTDIKKDSQTDILKMSILEKTVDSHILSFIEDLQERKQHTEFTSHNHYNNFESIFKKEKEDNLFVYYTGHCKNGNLILPNSSLLSLHSFTKILSKYENVICIMDCCNGGIDLPFVCHEKVYRFESEKFVKNNIISIAAALQDENSVTSRAGSFFTKNLLSVLSNSKLSVYQIVEKTKNINVKNERKKQTANISTSFPTLHYLFPFLYSQENLVLSLTPYFVEILRN